MSTWGWGDKGKKAHWFDGTDRAKCGKAIKVEDAEGVADKDKCAACRKAADVSAAVDAKALVDNTPTPVRNLAVAIPPGAAACPSTIHAKQRVRANWSGKFRRPINPQDDKKVTYCDWCAYLTTNMGFFFLDSIDPPVCVRCRVAYVIPAHDPCCVKDHPHGRPLCCHCYGVTHHVEGVPCH